MESGISGVIMSNNTFTPATWGASSTAVRMVGSNVKYLIRGNIGTNNGTAINYAGGRSHRMSAGTCDRSGRGRLGH